MKRIYQGEVPLSHLKPKVGETTQVWMERTTRARQNFQNHNVWVWPDLGKEGKAAERRVKAILKTGVTGQVIDL